MPRARSTSLLAAAAFALIAGLLRAPAAPAQEERQGADEGQPDSEVRRYKDWAVQCQQLESGNARQCVIFQRQILENGRTLMIMSVRRTPDDEAPLAVIRLPLGVLLEPGVSLSVDEGEPRNLAYRFCNQGGCIVSFRMNKDLETAFRRGQTANVSLMTAAQKQLNVKVSLSGFTAALNTL